MATVNLCKLSMIIYGSQIVGNARDIALSGEWMKAIQALRESLDGCTYEHALTILSGDYTLTGNSQDDNIDLVKDENSQDYKREMKEVYLSDLFYEDHQLYKLDRMIHPVEVRKLMEIEDRYFDNRTTPPEEQLKLVSSRLSYRDEIVFRIHSMEYMVAKKVDPNHYPLWFNKTDYNQSHLECYNNYLGATRIDEIKKENNIISTVKKEKEKEDITEKMIKRNNQNYIEHISKLESFDSVKEMSECLRGKVLSACKKRNVTWEKVELNNEKGEKHSILMPKEIVLGYLSKDVKYWEPICPSGLKMDNDSSWHSDLWLALGNDISADAYDHTLEKTKEFYEAIDFYRIQNLNEVSDFYLLNEIKMKSFEGKIVFENSKKITDKDILILPNAGLKYESIARKAGVVICEQGGQISHLVIVGKEEMFPVLLMKDAIKKLQYQYSIKIDFENKKILGRFN